MKPGREYEIRDRKALAGLIKELVEVVGEGSETKAAREIGLSQPTLNRYRNRKRGTMSLRVANAISDGLQRLPNPQLAFDRSEEHTSELQSQFHLVCRLLLEKKKQ